MTHGIPVPIFSRRRDVIEIFLRAGLTLEGAKKALKEGAIAPVYPGNSIRAWYTADAIAACLGLPLIADGPKLTLTLPNIAPTKPTK